jgi:hypothetical protein
MNLYWLVPAIALGYFVAKFFAGKKTGQQGRIRSVILNIGRYKMHLHHWLFSAIILIVLASFRIYHDVVYGLLIGMMIQGWTYGDFYKIVYKKR